MALGLLLSRKLNSILNFFHCYRICFCGKLVLSLTAHIFFFVKLSLALPQAKSTHPIKFQSYQKMQVYLDDLFAKSQTSIWLASEELADSNLTTSLYLAKYRNVQTVILLGKNKTRDISSQFLLLEKNQIPVATTQKSFFKKWPTYILLDGKLYLVSVPLADKGTHQDYSILQGKKSAKVDKLIKSFKRNFLASFRKGKSSNYQIKQNTVKRQTNLPKQSWTGFRSYLYDGRKRQKTPVDVSRRLPKITKWQSNRSKKK